MNGKRKQNKAPEKIMPAGGLTYGEMKPTYREGGSPLPNKVIPKGLAYGEIEMHDGAERTITGTSIFDPVLCELAYRWFCPPGGMILDPFAGGSVRGIVASKLGRPYMGVDLSERQVNANFEQAKSICKKPMPIWYQGDSTMLSDIVGKVTFDFVFSCPPYFDLEVYSDDPDDLSKMTWEDFGHAYRRIIKQCSERLADNRFAAFVIGDVRDERGFYRDLPGLTIHCFEEAGLRLYNRAILVTAAGSLPVRVGRQFETARKLGNTHQYLLQFVKGDPRKATEAIGPVEFGEPEEFSGTPVAEPAKYGERLTL